jgi:hypothetical protein
MSNGARTIIIESPDRFARELMVQLAGHDMLKARGVTLIAASAPIHFIEDPLPPSSCAKSWAPSLSSRRRPSSQAGSRAQAQVHRDRKEGRGAQESRRG